jgi:hypothetical protein
MQPVMDRLEYNKVCVYLCSQDAFVIVDVYTSRCSTQRDSVIHHSAAITSP